MLISHFQLLFSILQAEISDLVFSDKVKPSRLKCMNNNIPKNIKNIYARRLFEFRFYKTCS